MANKHLSLEPQNITDELWYYEEPKGINIVHEINKFNGEHIRTDQIIIPWSKIIHSLKRKNKLP